MNRGCGSIHIGTSEWQYPHWRGRFYPDEVPKRKWLELYADSFETVEVNNTFYGLPEPETVDEWRDNVPRGFRFALKFSRYGSHMKCLKDPDKTLPPFLSAFADRLVQNRDDGREQFVYFNNDAEAAAVEDALNLKRYLGRRMKNTAQKDG